MGSQHLVLTEEKETRRHARPAKGQDSDNGVAAEQQHTEQNTAQRKTENPALRGGRPALRKTENQHYEAEGQHYEAGALNYERRVPKTARVSDSNPFLGGRQRRIMAEGSGECRRKTAAKPTEYYGEVLE